MTITRILKVGKKEIRDLKVIQLELARLIKKNCKSVFITDAHAIRFSITIDNYLLTIPKLVAFKFGGHIDPKCNFTLTKFRLRNGKWDWDNQKEVEIVNKEDIINLLIKHDFLSIEE